MSLKDQLHEQFIIPVLRHENGILLEKMAQSLINSGMSVLEITLMSDDAYKVITNLVKKNKVTIAAGTVISEAQAQRAIDAGASLLVSPGLNEKAVKLSQVQKVPFIPGVLTPTEIIKAIELECNMIKVFPIESLGGVNYLKSLSGPFPKMNFMATGGITPENAKNYLIKEVLCIGMGGKLTPPELIKDEKWESITKVGSKIMSDLALARGQ